MFDWIEKQNEQWRVKFFTAWIDQTVAFRIIWHKSEIGDTKWCAPIPIQSKILLRLPSHWRSCRQTSLCFAYFWYKQVVFYLFMKICAMLLWIFNRQNGLKIRPWKVFTHTAFFERWCFFVQKRSTKKTNLFAMQGKTVF